MGKDIIGWNIIVVAGFYSQLAGVLSGFVFTAIILLLSNPPRGKEVKDISTPLYSLLVVFFSLIIASFLYAITTGDTTTARPFVMGMLASCVFALSAVQMFLSIARFFKEYNVSQLVMSSTKILFHGVVFIAAIYVIIIVGDTVWVKDGIDWKTDWHTFLWGFPILFFPLAGGIIRKRIHPFSDRCFHRIMIGSFSFTIAVAVYFGLVTDFQEEMLSTIYPGYAKYILMFFLGALFFLCELSLSE